jgi:hypothetical protein
VFEERAWDKVATWVHWRGVGLLWRTGERSGLGKRSAGGGRTSRGHADVIHHERAQDVPPLLALVRRVATEDAFMTSDPNGHRVALILPGGTTDQARELLADLRQELFANGGDGALSAIATLVLPNGEPFPLGSTFLNYVFEGE